MTLGNDFEVKPSGTFAALSESELEVRKELDRAHGFLRRLVEGYFSDTGAEPSVSCHGRTAVEAREYLENYKRKNA